MQLASRDFELGFRKVDGDGLGDREKIGLFHGGLIWGAWALLLKA